MTKLQILATVTCVLAISIGQLLFKKIGLVINETNSIFSYSLFKMFFWAMVLYGITTIFWILILRVVPLNKAHSFMALSFIFVAIGSNLVFGEPITLRLVIGLLFIIAGLFFIVNSY